MSKETSISRQPSSGLVKPSGNLTLPVIIKLHYPTKRTKHPLHGYAADESNPCTSLILKAGFTSANSLWLEEVYRRTLPPKNRSCPAMPLSDGERQVHNDFSQALEDASTSCVAIIFGKCNRSLLIERRLVSFPVRIENFEVIIGIQYRGDIITRLFVFADHPEYIIRRAFAATDIKVANRNDIAFGLTAAVAGIPDFSFGHFNESIARHRITLAATKELVSLRAQSLPVNNPRKSNSRSSGPSSQLGDSYDDLPPAIRHWLFSSYRISDNVSLVASKPSNTSTLEHLLRKLTCKEGPRPIEAPQYSDLPTILQASLRKDHSIVDSVSLQAALKPGQSIMDFVFGAFQPKKDHRRTKNRGLINSGRTVDGPCVEVEVKCESCGHMDVDRKPEWENTPVATNRAYIIKARTTCPGPKCCIEKVGSTGKRRREAVNYIPVDETLAQAAITQNAAAKRMKYNARREATPSVFSVKFLVSKHGPLASLEVKCFRCQNYRREEKHPIWFKRDGRYVARPSSCPVCKETDGITTCIIFVPVDGNLTYIRYSALRDSLGQL